MYKYQRKMNELGLQKSNLSRSLIDSINTIEQAIQEYETLNQSLSELDEDDPDYDEVKIATEEYIEDIERADAELEAKIQKYFDKRDYYAAKMEHLHKKVAEKKGGSPNPIPENHQNTSGNVGVPANPKGVETINQNQHAANGDGSEKKGGDFGSWLLWGGLAVLGFFVGVKIVKNRE